MSPLAAVAFVALAAAPTVYLNGHLPSPADSQSMAALGASGVRMDFNWFQFEPQPGQYDWGALDDAVNGARASGLGIFATIAYAPQWATGATCTLGAASEDARCENKVPSSSTAWAAAVTAVVTRYRGQVECWGIWNEPNLRGFFDGTMDQYVNTIFLPAAAAIRAADPQARICGPELSGLTQSSHWNGNQGTCAFGGCIRNGWERDLGQLLDRIGTHLDVITQHTYKSDAASVMGALLDGETSLGVLTHDSIRHVIESKGFGNKEFWLTETGWEHPPQGSVPLADVATRIVDLFAKQEEVCAGTYAASLNDGWSRWTRTYYFHFPYDPGSGWGLVGPGQAPLAPFSALQNWTNVHATTACAVGTTPRPPDAGVVLDAGTPVVDAGTPVVDAGLPSVDAGTPDVDAGTPPQSTPGGGNSQPDAGTPTRDAGAEVDDMPPAVGGCGCTSADPSTLVAGVVLVLGRRQKQERGRVFRLSA